MTTRRQLAPPVSAAILIATALVAAAQAQTYPNRPITFVVPFAAGGLSDVPARVLAAEMQERIGQSIVVENKPGASGITGATYVARAEPTDTRCSSTPSPTCRTCTTCRCRTMRSTTSH